MRRTNLEDDEMS